MWWRTHWKHSLHHCLLFSHNCMVLLLLACPCQFICHSGWRLSFLALWLTCFKFSRSTVSFHPYYEASFFLGDFTPLIIFLPYPAFLLLWQLGLFCVLMYTSGDCISSWIEAYMMGKSMCFEPKPKTNCYNLVESARWPQTSPFNLPLYWILEGRRTQRWFYISPWCLELLL